MLIEIKNNQWILNCTDDEINTLITCAKYMLENDLEPSAELQEKVSGELANLKLKLITLDKEIEKVKEYEKANSNTRNKNIQRNTRRKSTARNARRFKNKH